MISGIGLKGLIKFFDIQTWDVLLDLISNNIA